MGPLASLNVNPTASVFVAQNRGRNRARAGKVIHFTLWTTFVMGMVTGLGMFLGSGTLALKLHNENLQGTLRWSGLLLFSGP